MPTPINTLVMWLKKHDIEIQKDIALVMASLHPGFDWLERECPDHMLARFLHTLERCDAADLKNVGFLLAFKAIFEHSISSKRALIEGWPDSQPLIHSLGPELDHEHTPVSSGRLPEGAVGFICRKNLWLDVCEQWDLLTASELSDSAIDAWEREVFLERARRGIVVQEADDVVFH